MQTVKVFLASSEELKEDRKEFEIFIGRINNDWRDKGVSFELVIWEDFVEKMSQTRLQDEYNKALKECDIFIMLFFTKVGKYTREEFEAAFGQFKETNKPSIYTFFKDAEIKAGKLTREFATVLEFKERILELGHFHSTYENTEDLLLQFSMQLSKLQKKGFITVTDQDKKSAKGRQLNLIPNYTGEFIGRDEELKNLEKELQKSQKVVLMNGLGGIGKTTMAKIFTHRNQFQYDHIVWMEIKITDTTASKNQSTNPIVDSFAYDTLLVKNLGLEFGEKEDILHRFNQIMLALRNLDGNNLLIIDNAGDEISELLTVLPSPPAWQVLVTSRQKLEGFQSVYLDKLYPEAAKKLFSTYCTSTIDENTLSDILNEVDYHTLTIELIAKTIENSMGLLTLEIFAEKLKAKHLDDSDLQEKITTEHSKKETELYIHLRTAFNLSTMNDQEKQLMKQFAMLPPEKYLLTKLIDWLKIEEVDTKRFKDTLRGLEKKGWLKASSAGFEMHRLIQQVVHYQLQPTFDDVKDLIETFINLLSYDNSTNYAKLFPYMPYAEFIIANINRKQNDSKIYLLENNLAEAYRNFGEYRKVVEILEHSDEDLLKIAGKYSMRYSVRQSILGLAFSYLEENDKALEHLKKALEINISMFGENHKEAASAQSNLAAFYINLGEYEKARDLFIKVLNFDINSYGEDHYETAVDRSNLANVYQCLGEYEKARELYKEVLDNGIKNLGKDHPKVATRQSSLAAVYIDLKEYDKALELLEEAVANGIKNFGEHHFILVTRYKRLGYIFFFLKDYQKAENYYEKAFKISMKTVGANHHETKSIIDSLNYLARLKK